MAKRLGLRPGFSLDLTAPEPFCYRLEFPRADCRKRAWDLVYKQRPYVLIGGPLCAAFSILQNFQRIRPGGDAKVDEMIRKANVHVEFCAELYAHQLRRGRDFLHEHPQSASSLKMPAIEALASHPKVLKATTHICVSIRND